MAILTDCPVEILAQVIVHLDDPSLLCISKLTQALNRIGLSELFRRHDSLDNGSVNVHPPHQTTMLVLHALRFAVWIKRVYFLRFHSQWSQPLLPELFEEVHCLTVFIHQLESLESFEFSCEEVRYPAIFPAVREERLARRAYWQNSVNALLDIVLSKGIKEFKVVGGSGINDHIEIAKPIPSRQKASAMGPTRNRDRSWRVSERMLVPIIPARCVEDRKSKERLQAGTITSMRMGTRENTNYPPFLPLPQPPLSKLHKFHIDSPILLSPLFLLKTLDILTSHASTIHSLTLNYQLEDQSRWKYILQQVQFASLQWLSCYGEYFFRYPRPNPTGIPEALLAFAQRHPSISSLRICRAPQLCENGKEIPHLPHLKVVTSHATTAAHLLLRPDNCRRLQSLHLLFYAPESPLDSLAKDLYECLDSILSSIADFCTQSIALEIEFDAAFATIDWMRDHTDRGSGSVICKLTQVYKIDVKLPKNVSPDTFRTVLPKWLGLFPMLEVLKVRGLKNNSPAFNEAVISSCPRLIRFTMDLEHVIPLSIDAPQALSF